MEETERNLLIRTRRDLHRHPELAFEEHRTAALVAERLQLAGYEVSTGVGGTGVVGLLRGAGDGPTILLRADMDALPVTEESEHDFVSTVHGVMHACGHDAHVAIGLAVAERLARSKREWSGSVKYIFQPAEESGGGAVRMIDDGVLEGVDAAIGLHVWLGLESGVVGVVAGEQMASAIEFEVTIRGRGGHGALPHEAVDAVLIGSRVVLALQKFVSLDGPLEEPAVLTIGSFEAGTAGNVVAETAFLRGTARTFDAALYKDLPHRIEAIVAEVCASGGGGYSIETVQSLPATVNDPAMADLVRRAAEEVVGREQVRADPTVRTFAAEDFSELLQRVPGCFFFVGGKNAEVGAVHPHHSPRFDLCEDALPVAVEVLERAARLALREVTSGAS